METDRSSFPKGCLWGVLLALPFWAVVLYVLIR